MSTKKCIKCGNFFEARLPSHTTCPDCHPKTSRRELETGRPQETRGFSHHPQSGSSLPANLKLDSFYGQGNAIRAEVYTTVSQGIADLFAREQMTSTSIRRFFESVRSAHERLQQDPDRTSNPQEAYARAMEKLNRLLPIAAKSEDRGVTKRCFTDFMRHYVEMTAKNERNLKGFKELFMSVIGYLKK